MLFHDGGEGFALDMLHDDVRSTVRLDVAVGAHDVRMPEPMDGARFLDEPFETPGKHLCLVR